MGRAVTECYAEAGEQALTGAVISTRTILQESRKKLMGLRLLEASLFLHGNTPLKLEGQYNGLT